MLKKGGKKLEYVIAIGYMETVLLEMKDKKEKVTMKSLENKLNKLLDRDKEIIIAYAKVALDNINHSANKITVREMEAQIQNLKDLYTIEKLIEKAKTL